MSIETQNPNPAPAQTLTAALAAFPTWAKAEAEAKGLNCGRPSIEFSEQYDATVLRFDFTIYSEGLQSLYNSRELDPAKPIEPQVNAALNHWRGLVRALPTEAEAKFSELIRALERARELGEAVDIGEAFRARIQSTIDELSSNALTDQSEAQS